VGVRLIVAHLAQKPGLQSFRHGLFALWAVGFGLWALGQFGLWCFCPFALLARGGREKEKKK
jgi:hypothetical protein